MYIKLETYHNLMLSLTIQLVKMCLHYTFTNTTVFIECFSKQQNKPIIDHRGSLGMIMKLLMTNNCTPWEQHVFAAKRIKMLCEQTRKLKS